MQDYQKAVDDIRSFLESGDLTAIDQIRQAAVVYAQGCQEVNQRLRRCDEFLQQRLYSEAIHLAQSEPPVLDLLALLDFPERERWEEAAILYDINTPPKLHFEVAQALNEAYGAVQPLEHLLRRHRLLALARAPLPTRLGVMQQIARIDPTNQYWADDVRAFEKRRFEELARLINHSLDHGDTDGAAPLLREYRSAQWLSPPPRALVHAMERSTDQQNLAILRRLQTELQAAYTALDFPTAQKLRDQWVQQVRTVRLDAGDPVFDRAAPALDWVAEQERRFAHEQQFQAALNDLVNALDVGASNVELARCRENVLKTGEAVPFDVEDRYQNCLATRERAGARKRWVTIAASALVCVAIALCVYGAISAIVKNSRRAETAIHIQQLVDKGQLAEARAALSQLMETDAGANADVRVLDVQEHLALAENAEKDRVARLDKALKEAEAAPLTDDEPSAFAEARKLLRSPEEAAALNRIMGLREERLRQVRAEKDQSFQKELEVLLPRLVHFEGLVDQGTAESAELEENSRSLQSEAERLDADAAKVEVSTKDLWKDMKARLANTKKTMDLLIRSRQEEQAVTKALGNGVDAYVGAAQKYIEACPGTPRTTAMTNTLKEKKLWQRIAEWNALIAPHADSPLDLSSADAKSLLTKCEALLADNADFIDAPAAIEYVAFLKGVAQRDEEDSESAAAGLRKLFADSMVGDLWILRAEQKDKVEKIYYLKQDVSREVEAARRRSEGGQSEILNIHHYVGFDGSMRSYPLQANSIRETKRAPQSKLADEVKQLPRDFGGKNWDAYMIKIIKRLQTDPDFDPIPQVLLLKRVLDLAGKGSHPLKLALQARAQAIEQANLDVTIAWIDPEIDASSVREQAADVVKKLPPLDDVLPALQKARRELEQAISGSRSEVVGWLARDKHGAWSCRTPAPTFGTQRLFVIVPAAAGSELQWHEVGKCIEGKISIYAGALDSLAEGRLVYARTPR